MAETPSTSPLKGFRDFYPEDMRIQRYIFDTWQRVCTLHGFDEYNGPVLENIQIYNKSGADIGTLGKELFAFEDRGGRHVTLRPEMTPTVGRMVAARHTDYPKPIKWFSIAQFFRAEKPQRGRGREFFQLNADIFGSDDIVTDTEVLTLTVDLMKSFGATSEMFTVRINHRQFIDWYFNEKLGVTDPEVQTVLMRIIDAAPKKSDEWLVKKLGELNNKKNFIDSVKTYLSLDPQDIEKLATDHKSASEINQLLSLITDAGIGEFITFDPAIMRGFDYYTGMVFEVFDKNPENNRAMFGGGRYDKLLEVFDKPPIPAVGFAPGDMTMRLFLESWDLLPDMSTNQTNVLVTVFPSEENRNFIKASLAIAADLRQQGVTAELFTSTSTPIAKQISYASKRGIPNVIIIGEEELKQEIITVKNLETGEQKSYSRQEALSYLLSPNS